MNEQKKKKILEKADELSKASEIAISLSRIDGHIAACLNESLAIVTAASLNSYFEEVMPTIALSRIAQAVAMSALARQYIDLSSFSDLDHACPHLLGQHAQLALPYVL